MTKANDCAALLCLLMASAGCSAGASPSSSSVGVSTTATLDVHVLQDIVDAYVQCLSGPLDGYIRVNLERFAGVHMEVQLPDGSDDLSRIEHIVEECSASTGFDRAMDRYSQAQAYAEYDMAGSLSDFGHCVADVLVGQETQARLSDIQSAADLHRFVHEFLEGSEDGQSEMERDSAGREAAVVVDCYDEAVYGERVNF